MAKKQNSLDRFWKELKRRKVVHVITVYAATAFVILEVVDMIAQPLHFPEWTQAFIIVLLCIGFIISVVVSWVYDITPAGVRKTKPAREIVHSDQTLHKVSSGWKIATYVSAIIIITLLAFNFINRRNLSADIARLEKSIAVLPFINDSPDSTNQYICNGIMDEILTQLQKIGNLQVKSRTSGERYRNPNKDIKEIGRELGASFIVEGSVRKVKNNLRITVQLINAKTGNHLWADTYNGEFTDKIFEFQNNLAIKVASSLSTVLSDEEKQLIDKNPTSNLPAYDLYLRANKYLDDYQKKRDVDSYHNAITFYKAALSIDPSFAKAYTGLAFIYFSAQLNRGGEYFNENYLDTIQILTDKALSFDDKLDEAFYLKGKYYMEMGEFDKALIRFDNALKYNPNYFAVYQDKGYLLTWLSIDFIKCIDNYNSALNLCGSNNRPQLLRALGHVYQDIGFPDKAKYFYDEAYTIDSSIIHKIGELAELAFYSENIEEGLKIERKMIELNSTYIPGELMMLGEKEEAYLLAKRTDEQYKKSGELNLQESHRIGYAFNRVGKEKEAKYYFDQQIKFSEEVLRFHNRRLSKSNAAIYDLAATYAFLDEKVKAYKYLDEFERRSNFSLWWILYLKYDPLFNKIREEERFQKILLNIQVKYEAEHERVRRWLEEQGMI